jgi:predicted esterase
MKKAFANSYTTSTRNRVLLTMALIAAIASSPAQSAGDFDPLKARGTVVLSLPCLSDPTQTYALYLPSNYSPERQWPIIYAFDPFARGKVPVELYQDAAEKYGYIVAGSNNAKNGQGALEFAAAQAVWEDTHRRFAIDKDRAYTTGLSGGARFATSLALYCYTCSIAGVIAHGAGYPVKEAAVANDHFLYYVAVGDADFNLPEILALRKQKEEHGASFKVKIYPGPHQWAPKDVVEDAIEWLQVKAMQAGKVKLDPPFIQREKDKLLAEARDAEQRDDTVVQFYALRSLVFDFKGLEDVTRFEAELAAVKSSKSLKRAVQEEQKEIDKQESLVATTAGQITQFGTLPPGEEAKLRPEIISQFSDLRRQAKSKSRDHMVYLRAFNQLWIEGIEAGQEDFRENQLVQAAAYFELMADVAPDQSWPLVLLADTQVRAGNRKAALKALEEAAKRGMKSPETLTQDPELKPLFSDPAFQRIVQSVGKSRKTS